MPLTCIVKHQTNGHILYGGPETHANAAQMLFAISATCQVEQADMCRLLRTHHVQGVSAVDFDTSGLLA